VTADTDIPGTLQALATVAQQLADVSPAWAAACVDAASIPPSSVDAGTRDRTIGVEAIREGWLLHRGASRIATGSGEDLALLVGDWCYAAGLCAIADHGSLDDVADLAALVADVSVRAGEPIEALDERWDEATARIAARASREDQR
jgi:hypothetical protein